ncbi:unnamed protein product [Leptidea sinapis]|uniref:Uncharacterized protein n=1 Tax=Leptidea sinapis TaxID=189913 RepID=A0A5E4QIP1_9NEOP|nr:unnamed protein product [Leptidea sinapis]
MLFVLASPSLAEFPAKIFDEGTKMAPAVPPGEKCKSIIEGLAEIRVESNIVSYNPVQEFNRDVRKAVHSTFVK